MIAIVVAIVCTDHLFSPFGMTVKHLGFACCQVVQKPVALSFHVPVLRSGANVIVNLVPPGVEAVKDWPLKKVAFMSLAGSAKAQKRL